MPKIEDYALLGDLHTAALVSTTGSIDWLCLPRFDSAAAFAALLDSDAAGYWRLAPATAGPPGAGRCAARRYAGNTLVLETDWVTPDGTVRVIDFMPPRAGTPHIVRITVGLSGQVTMRSVLRPRFDYGREVPWIREFGSEAREVHAIAGPNLVRLVSGVPVHSHDWQMLADFTVRAGDRVPFVLSWAPSYQLQMPYADAEQALAETMDFWAGWSSHASYPAGPYSDAVRPVGHHPEGADLPADRRDRRGGDHITAGRTRRRPQLGLPLLLAPRCHLRAAGTAGRRFPARSRSVARLAAPVHRGSAGHTADPVQR